MTRKQWKELTPEEQRIKVAELCGWTDCQRIVQTCDAPRGIHPQHAHKRIWHRVIPDYLNDLNAMHEAVCNQGIPFCISFYHSLLTVIGHHDHMEMEAVIATAAQRAEAFVLAMELR